MKRRKPIRPIAQIEAHLSESLDWVKRRQRQLMECEDGSAVIRIFSDGIERDLTDGDSDYEYYRNIWAIDLAAEIEMGNRNVKRFQKEHKKVSRFLARQKRQSERGPIAP